jgi:hypothetical protein
MNFILHIHVKIVENIYIEIHNLCLFVTEEILYTIQYHGGLKLRELGQTPMLMVFLTPRQA